MNDAELIRLFEYVREQSTFAGKSIDELWPERKEDGRYFGTVIERVDGDGSHIISLSALSALQRVVSERIITAPMKGRITSESVFQELKKEVDQHILFSETILNQSTCTKICNRVRTASKQKMQDITFIFPLSFTVENRPIEFALGPVNFLSRTAFRRSIKGHLRKLSTDDRNEQGERYRSGLAGAIRQYSSYGWVCVVEATNFESGLGEAASQRTVRIAIAALQVIFCGRRVERIRLLDRPSERGWVDSLTFNHASENFEIRSSQNSDCIHLGNDWVEKFKEDEGALKFAAVLSQALEQSQNNFEVGYVNARIANALLWFSEANYSSNKAVAISKYVTSLEALFNVGKDDVSETVSHYASVCYMSVHTDEDHQLVFQLLKKFYTRRSDFVHGQVVIVDNEVDVDWKKVRQITADCIFGLLYNLSFGQSWLTYGAKEYHQMLDRFVSVVKKADQNRAE